MKWISGWNTSDKVTLTKDDIDLLLKGEEIGDGACKIKLEQEQSKVENDIQIILKSVYYNNQSIKKPLEEIMETIERAFRFGYNVGRCPEQTSLNYDYYLNQFLNDKAVMIMQKPKSSLFEKIKNRRNA